jgi:Uma2 family endonuclease
MDVAVGRLTVREFLEMEFDDSEIYAHLYELLDGEIVRHQSAPAHQRVVRNLLVRLDGYVNERQLGEVFSAPLDVYLDEHNAPQPDLFFIPTADARLVTEQGIEGVPTLMVEVSSPTSIVRDRVTKKEIYERVGVAEYWIVDPQYREIEIYALTAGRYHLHSAATVLEGELVSRLFPELKLILTELFA